MGGILAEAALQLFGAVVEVPVRGLGYGLLRYCARRRHLSWGGYAVLIVGLLAWLAIFILGYTVWHWLVA